MHISSNLALEDGMAQAPWYGARPLLPHLTVSETNRPTKHLINSSISKNHLQMDSSSKLSGKNPRVGLLVYLFPHSIHDGTGKVYCHYLEWQASSLGCYFIDITSWRMHEMREVHWFITFDKTAVLICKQVLICIGDDCDDWATLLHSVLHSANV